MLLWSRRNGADGGWNGERFVVGFTNLMGYFCLKIKRKRSWFSYCVCVASIDKADVFYSLGFVYLCNDSERQERCNSFFFAFFLVC